MRGQRTVGKDARHRRPGTATTKLKIIIPRAVRTGKILMANRPRGYMHLLDVAPVSSDGFLRDDLSMDEFSQQASIKSIRELRSFSPCLLGRLVGCDLVDH